MRSWLILPLVAFTNIGYAGDFFATTGIDYSTGNYGQAQSTDITAIPFIAKYTDGPITLKASVAHLTVKSPANTVLTGDTVLVTGNSTGSKKTQNGWGDWVVSGSYSVIEQAGWLVDLTGKVKFATADKNKGLTTGENDYSILIDVYKTVDSFTLFGGGGRKFVGNPSGASYRDIWLANAGATYKVDKTTSVGLTYDYVESINSSKQARQELTIFGVNKFTDNFKIQVYGVAGLNNNSADWGAGALLGYEF